MVMLMKQLFLAIIPLLLVVAAISNVYAGGPRHDYPENYEDILGAPECWVDGFDAGASNSLNEKRADECADIPGDQYNRGFVGGQICNDLERSEPIRDDCERAISMPDTVSECIDQGYEDGKNGEWDTSVEVKCTRMADEGTPYRNALEEGCHAGGFPRENCDEINH
jgi:hypothetical protein